MFTKLDRSIFSIPEQRNPFLATVAFVLFVVWLFTLEAMGAFADGPRAFAAGIAAAVAPVALYVVIALLVDRYETEPGWMLAAAFMWGATIAVFLATAFNPARDTAYASIKAAPVEELAKGVALFALFFLMRDEFDNGVDGMIYGTMIGLGFAMTENVPRYTHAWSGGELQSLMMLRGLATPFSHPLFTAMTGLGLGLARESRSSLVKVAAPLGGLGLAMGVHAAWNHGTNRVIMVLVFSVMVTVVVWQQWREREIIRHQLSPYVASGHLSDAERIYLSSLGGRLRALWEALEAGRLAGFRAEAAFQQAASELAFHCSRVERGISRGEASDQAREKEYLRVLDACRARRPRLPLSRTRPG